MFFSDEGKNYRYIWTIEYDVYCQGSWEEYLNKYSNDESDFIANRLTKTNKKGIWYNRFKAGTSKAASERYIDVYRTFNPIMRFSNKGLTYICDELKDGRIYGFYEWLYPTMLIYGGYTIKSIDEKYMQYREESKNVEGELINGNLYHPLKKIITK